MLVKRWYYKIYFGTINSKDTFVPKYKMKTKIMKES